MRLYLVNVVIGAAGTIGQAVTLELFKGSKSLHAVDISENNMDRA